MHNTDTLESTVNTLACMCPSTAACATQCKRDSLCSPWGVKGNLTGGESEECGEERTGRGIGTCEVICSVHGQTMEWVINIPCVQQVQRSFLS